MTINYFSNTCLDIDTIEEAHASGMIVIAHRNNDGMTSLIATMEHIEGARLYGLFLYGAAKHPWMLLFPNGNSVFDKELPIYTPEQFEAIAREQA